MVKVVCLLTIIISSSLYSQTVKEKFANELFENREYYQSAELYEEILERSKSPTNFEIYKKAAISFYKIKKYDKAEKYFQIVVENTSLEASSLILYLNTLERSENYLMISKYKDLFTGLSLSKDRLENFKYYLDSLAKDSSRYLIKKLPLNSGMGDYGAFQKNDSVFFSSLRNSTKKDSDTEDPKYSDVFVSTVQEGLKTAILVEDYSDKYHDGPICFQDDKVYLTKTKIELDKKNTVKNIGVFYGRRGEELVAFPFNEVGYNVGHIAFSPDELCVYFSSDMPGGEGGSDIYYSRMEHGKWLPAVNLGTQVNTKGDELFPFVDKKGVLYFSSNGRLGFGGMDVFYLDSNENIPINIGYPLNSKGDDFSYFKNIDGKSGYFSSDREDDIDNIYSFRQMDVSGLLKVVSIDKSGGRPIENATVFIVDQTTFDTVVLAKNGVGEFVAPIFGNRHLKVFVMHSNYQQQEAIEIDTKGLQENEVLEQAVRLMSSNRSVSIKTISADTKAPVANVGLQIYISPEVTKQAMTSVSGNAEIQVHKKHSFQLLASKQAFLDWNASYQKEDTVSEIVIAMNPIRKDVVFEMKNVLYDIGSAELREESKIELNKLILFLQMNNSVTIELSSHTDSRSDADFNLLLSKKRAHVCLEYLLNHGVSPNRVVVKGYGESKLFNRCKDGVECSEFEHQQNRRTEIKILSLE